MKKIGILGAMEQEITLIQQSLQNLTTVNHQHMTFYCGTLHGVEVILARCGIGKVAAAVGTSVMIERFAPECVINTGSAGGFDQDLNIGDLVIGESVLHHDVDLTHFGYALGQCAGGMPATYTSDARLIAAAQAAAAKLDGIQCKTGQICTGDAFIGSDEAALKIKHAFPHASATEMEGAAIAQSAHLLNTPCLVIRSLSDIAGKTSTESFTSYLEKAAKHSAELVMDMIAQLASDA